LNSDLTCENCNRPLAPDATDAMICSFECTFCRDCVDTALSNVCPNCGEGFERRPVRPAHAWIEGETRVPPPRRRWFTSRSTPWLTKHWSR
jgi:hypothetical protein